MSTTPRRPEAIAGIALAAAAVLLLGFLLLWQPASSGTSVDAGPEPAPENPGEERAGTPGGTAGTAGGGPHGSFGEHSGRSAPDAGGTGGLLLTVPKLEHLRAVPVPTADGADTDALDANAAVRLAGTGMPGERNSNVYISGHRTGYEGTPSYRAFHDLDRLEKGDAVILTGPGGTTYTYRVYEVLEDLDPSRVEVAQPVAGKQIVSLQTCTLPDYSRRLVVRAELTDEEATSGPHTTRHRSTLTDDYGGAL